MRIRNFKWSTDVLGPSVGALLVIWGILADGPRVAVFGGYLFVVMALYVLGRLERMQADGSYRSLVSDYWYRWIDPRTMIFGMLAGTLIVSVALFLMGLPIHLAIAAGAGLAAACLLIIVWARRISRR